MTMTKKHLPAILLAVIIAAALSLSLGLTGQPAFAADTADDYTIVIQTANDTDKAIPGQTLSMDDTTIYDKDFNDVTGSAMVTDFQWSIGEGSAYATVDFDPNDFMMADVTFGALPEGSDGEEVDVVLTLTIDGKPYKSEPCALSLVRSYYNLEADDVDSHLLTGESEDVHVEMLHYTEGNPEGIPVEETSYSWYYDKNQVAISPETASGSEADFTVTRKSDDDAVFYVTASYKTEDGLTEEDGSLFFFDEISNNLNNFEVDITNNNGLFYRYVDSTAETFVPNVEVKFGSWVLPETEYDLVIEKYEGYNEETGDEIWVNYTEEALKVDPEGTVNESGEETGGTATYRFKATAKAGSKYTGETTDNLEYLYMLDQHTFNSALNAELRMKDGTEDVKFFFIDEYPYLQYNVTPGTTLTPVVAAREPRTTLTQDKDYKVSYIDLATGDVETTFPTEYGDYLVLFEGIGDYYGADVQFTVKVGDTNNFTAKVKKVIKVKKGKKKTVAAKKAFTVKNKKGTVKYTKVAVNGKYDGSVFNKITVSSTGKVTVKKGLKKGTYKVRVNIADSGTTKYQPAYKVVTLKVKVKK